MNHKHAALCILVLIAIVAVVGIVLMIQAEKTGAFPLVKIQGRARPGDSDYAGYEKPYNHQQTLMPPQAPTNPNQQ